MIRRLTLQSLRALALGIAATALLVAGAQLCGPGAEASRSSQSSQSRTVDWYYWLDTATRQIQRSRLDGSGVAETIVTSSEMSAPTDFALDPNGSHVYWTDNGHDQIRRKSADGTGSVEVLFSGGITTPNRIAVDNTYVYWTDDGNDTIKRGNDDGSGSATTLAGSTDGVNVPTAIDLHGSYLYWSDDGSNAVYEVQLFGSNTVTTLISAGLVVPHDLEVGRSGSYVYVLDRNGTSSTIKRVTTYSPYTVTTLASNTSATPMDDPVALALDPANDYVYWLDEDDNAVRRVAADGTSGTFETLTTAAGSTARDLVLSRSGSSVYWLDDNGNRAKHIFTSGGMVKDVITTGLNVPLRIRRSQDSDRVDGSCITDAGPIDADYATHEWEADIDATCPRAFYRFTLSGDADLRIAATSSSIDPAPVLRKGGLAGPLAALTSASGGASVPYVYTMAAGDYTIELVRGSGSSGSSGAFSAKLQTQPALDGCDVNVGALSSDQLNVFGAYDADCGANRNYFFYLEFQASVSASLNALNFSPVIELRPGSASDSATATATDSGNPADIYQQVTSGSYRIKIRNIDADSTYNLSLQAFGLPPPTRTPIPTPTPRFQPNVDVRLDPHPQGVSYERGQVYRFRLEGGEGSFPAVVRLDGGTAFRLTSGSASRLDCSAGSQVSNVAQLASVYLHVCGSGSGAIQVLKQGDYGLLAAYSIYVPGEAVPEPTAVDGPQGYVKPEEDRIGLGILINAVCDGANVGCNVGLLRNGIGASLSGVPLLVIGNVRRGRVSHYSIGIGVALFIVGLILSHYFIGMPIWYGVIPVIAVVFLTGVQVYLKFRRVGA